MPGDDTSSWKRVGVAAQDIRDATTDLVVDALRVIDQYAQDSAGDLHVDNLDIGELRHDVALDLVRDGRPLIGPRHCCSFLPGKSGRYSPNEKAGLKPALLALLDFRPLVRPDVRIAGETSTIPADVSPPEAASPDRR